jgi:menaquinol-cytochrome c reductase iron-sulfur subunit
MKWFVGGIAASTGGILGIPALTSVFSPVLKLRRKEQWRGIGEIDRFQEGAVVAAKVSTRLDRELISSGQYKHVYVWKQAADDFVVYSRSCTDLGCPVTFDAGSECFYCPCHGGVFSKEGERMAGPPKYPLFRYSTRVREGFLEIDLASVPAMA